MQRLKCILPSPVDAESASTGLGKVADPLMKGFNGMNCILPSPVDATSYPRNIHLNLDSKSCPNLIKTFLPGKQSIFVDTSMRCPAGHVWALFEDWWGVRRFRLAHRNSSGKRLKLWERLYTSLVLTITCAPGWGGAARCLGQPLGRCCEMESAH